MLTNYKILVTDVTEFGELFCVAGWDLLSGRMVRPEPPGTSANAVAGRFWTAEHVGADKVFSVGNVVTCQGVNAPKGFSYPHATEDVVLDAGSMINVVSRETLAATAGMVAGSVSQTLAAVYDGGLARRANGKAYVSKDHNGRSLGAIEIASDALQFHENRYKPDKPKLRSWVTVGGISYDIPVTAVAAHQRWRKDGLAALTADAANAGRIHLRMGLARPWSAQPDECFVQINGILFLS